MERKINRDYGIGTIYASFDLEGEEYALQHETVLKDVMFGGFDR